MNALLVSLLLTAGIQAATLTGAVADRDIYHGERLEGATVWLDDGTTVSTVSTGYYTFEGLGTGTYTAHAVADGFLEGTCTKTIESDDTYWCSIALEPDPGGGDTGEPPDDTGEAPSDTGEAPSDTDSHAQDSDPPVDDSGGSPDDTAQPGSFPPRRLGAHVRLQRRPRPPSRLAGPAGGPRVGRAQASRALARQMVDL